MKERLVLLVTNLAPGGAETQVALLARGLARRGWSVCVISLLPPSAFARQLSAAGVPVYSLGMRPGVPNPLAFLGLLVLLRRLRPRILHSHMFHANLMARLARLLCPVPVLISTLHSAAESGRNSASLCWRDRLYRWTDPLTTVTVAVAGAVAGRHVQARAVRPSKVLTIPNGVDTERFKPDPGRRSAARAELGLGGEFVWLAAGRLMWKKGYQTLLRAFTRLTGSVLLIAGSGPQEADLRQLAGELGVAPRFLGHREDIADLMAASDAFVQSSLVEGLPLSLLEASASALPCVASDAGASGDVVQDGITGFLVPIGNPDALAAAMLRLAALPAGQRLAMGQAARARVQAGFDINAVLSRWEALYGELLLRWT